jgi:hypothetical protein
MERTNTREHCERAPAGVDCFVNEVGRIPPKSYGYLGSSIG